MAFLAAAASGFTLPQAAPAVVMARPQFSSVAPVMMAKKGEDVPWSIDTLLAGPKAKFVASGVERKLSLDEQETDGTRERFASKCQRSA